MRYKSCFLRQPNRKSSLILLLFLSCFFTLSAQTSGDTSVKRQILHLNRQMEDAFNNNDMNKVAAFYADDGEIVYDNGYTVKERSNLDNYWIALKDKGRGWKLTVVEIGGQGEFAFQLGTSHLKHISQGKEVTSITNFVLIWKKQANGNYKIFRDYLTKTKFVKNE